MRDNQYYIQQCLDEKADLEEKISETESIIQHLNDYKEIIKRGKNFDKDMTKFMIDQIVDTAQELEGYLSMFNEKKEENEESYSYYLGRE